MKIILASKSPRRRELLGLLGVEFDILDTKTNEACDISPEPDALVQGLSLRKAQAAQRLCGADALIIAADTVVCIGSEILGKPKDREQARQMMHMLSDAYHEVYTGYTLMYGNKIVMDHCITRVKMRSITEDEIERYISTSEPYDKAGGYGIQERGGAFVERIEGNYHNVVGLPVCDLAQHLAVDFGIKFI